MPISVVKTWKYVVNQVEAPGVDLTDRNTRLWIALKHALCSTGGVSVLDSAGASSSVTSPWIVVSSSNSVTASAADNWSTASDIVGAAAGAAHSWIHLKQTDYFGAGDHLHLLLAVENAAACTVGRVSYTRGATGYNNDGTTTNRPTHAETTAEVVVKDGTSPAGNAKTADVMWGSDSVLQQAVLHMRIADDGSAGAWFLCAGSVVLAWFGWQDEQEGNPSETHPFVMWGASVDATTEVLGYVATLNLLDIYYALDGTGAAVNTYYSTMPVFTSSKLPLNQYNQGTSKLVFPLYFASVVSPTIRGELIDMWWSSTTLSTGDQSPATPPVTRAQLGECMIPWPSGVTIQVA